MLMGEFESIARVRPYDCVVYGARRGVCHGAVAPKRDEERRALFIGGVTDACWSSSRVYLRDPPDLLFAAVLFVIQALFSYAVFVPFGMIFADRAMCLRSR